MNLIIDNPDTDGMSSPAVKEAADRFAEIEKKRAKAMDSSRIIIRMTKNMIHAIHVGEPYDLISTDLHDNVDEFIDALKDEPSVFYSAVVQDALSEYAEACIFAVLVSGGDPPSFDSLKVTPQAWAMGLADTIGELRRMILKYLIDGRVDDARMLFERMETVGDDVLGFDVPDAVAPIRRKQDVARSIIEKTRSDITNAVMLAQYNKR